MTAPAFLALDAGTGSGRAALFDAAGRLLACASRPWTYQESRAPGDFWPGHEFDAGRFWGLLAEATREVLERSGVAPRDVAGVAATSQREGSVLLDARGAEMLATPNFDSRGIVEGVEVTERLGADRLYRVTGHSPAFVFPLSRLLWWRSRFPDRPVAKTLMISDWVTYRLTAEAVAEPSNAGESLLFDVEKRAWSDEILDAFAIDRSVLPTLLSSGALAGRVTRPAAEATGLLEGTPVFTGGADTQCALLGSGAISAGDTGVVLGTTGPVQRVLDAPAFDPVRQLWLGPHVVPGRWVLESNAGDTGKAYEWLLGLLGVPSADARDYAAIEREAEGARADLPVFSYLGPSVFDLRNLNPARPAAVLFPYPFGRPRPGRAELVLGYLESIAYAVRANLEQIEAAAGARVDRLWLGGGMTRSPLLLRVLGQVTGLPLRVSEQPEAAALGCALLAARGAGVHRDLEAAVRAAVRSIDHEPGEAGPYAERYRKWRELGARLDQASVP